MTKELNLSVNDTSEITSDKTADAQKSTPKEGKSLFDNLLSNISDKDTSAKKTNQTDDSKTTSLTSVEKKEINSNTVNSTVINKTPETKTQKEQIVNNYTQHKSVTSEIPVKVENKTLTLMDRILLESAQKVAIETESTNEPSMIKNQTDKVFDNSGISKTSETIDLGVKTEKQTDKNIKSNIKTADGKKSEIINKEVIKTDNVENMKNSNSKSLLDNLLKDISTQIKAVTPSTVENTAVQIDKSQIIKSDESKTSDPVISKLQTLITEEAPLKIEIAYTEKDIKISEKNSPLSVSETKLNVSPKIDINNTTIESKPIVNLETKPLKDLLSKEVQKNEPTLHMNNSEVSKPKIEATVVKENSKIISSELKAVKPEKSLMDQLFEESKSSIKNNNEKILDSKISAEKNIVTKDVLKDIVSTVTKVSEPTIAKNEKVANELSKISSSQVESHVNISKDDIKKFDEINKPEKAEKAEKMKKPTKAEQTEQNKKMKKPNKQNKLKQNESVSLEQQQSSKFQTHQVLESKPIPCEETSIRG